MSLSIVIFLHINLSVSPIHMWTNTLDYITQMRLKAQKWYFHEKAVCVSPEVFVVAVVAAAVVVVVVVEVGVSHLPTFTFM